jgi:hypothetical protein
MYLKKGCLVPYIKLADLVGNGQPFENMKTECVKIVCRRCNHCRGNNARKNTKYLIKFGFFLVLHFELAE